MYAKVLLLLFEINTCNYCFFILKVLLRHIVLTFCVKLSKFGLMPILATECIPA
jgi:hypothetical protein